MKLQRPDWDRINRCVKSDWRGTSYPGKCPGEMTTEFLGTVRYSWIESADELQAALEYGKYLEANGYKKILGGEMDTLQLKLIWYLSTRENGITKEMEEEKEMVFAIKIGRCFYRQLLDDDGRTQLDKLLGRSSAFAFELTDFFSSRLNAAKSS